MSDCARAAGLVRGASDGAGLGNQFLDNIRNVSAILHAVRCFEDEDVLHVENSVDPLRDLDIIRSELLLADLQTLERRRAAVRAFSLASPRRAECSFPCQPLTRRVAARQEARRWRRKTATVRPLCLLHGVYRTI